MNHFNIFPCVSDHLRAMYSFSKLQRGKALSEVETSSIPKILITPRDACRGQRCWRAEQCSCARPGTNKRQQCHYLIAGVSSRPCQKAKSNQCFIWACPQPGSASHTDSSHLLWGRMDLAGTQGLSWALPAWEHKHSAKAPVLLPTGRKSHKSHRGQLILVGHRNLGWRQVMLQPLCSSMLREQRSTEVLLPCVPFREQRDGGFPLCLMPSFPPHRMILTALRDPPALHPQFWVLSCQQQKRGIESLGLERQFGHPTDFFQTFLHPIGMKPINFSGLWMISYIHKSWKIVL